MTVFIPVGIPGSGKSFLGKKYFKPSEIVSLDDIRERLTDDVSDQSCTPVAAKIANQILEYRMKRGLDTYLDGTNLNPKFWPDADFGQDRIFIIMSAGKETCFQRNNNRERVVPTHVLERMWDTFDNDSFMRQVMTREWVLDTDFNRQPTN